MMFDIGNDPPDPNYTSIAVPEVSLPPISGAATSDSLAANFERVRAFGRAMLTSFERYLGAVEADADTFVQLQLRAMANYGAELVEELNASAEQARTLGAELAADPDGNNPIVTQTDLESILAVRERVTSEGFTTGERQELEQAGLATEEIDDFETEFAVDMSDAPVDVSIESVLRDLADSYEAGAAAFELMSRHANVIADNTNQPPVAADDTLVTRENAVREQSVLVTSNDLDLDGDSLSVIANTAPGHGVANCSTLITGQCTYLPEPHFIGQDSFEYTVEDGHGGSDTATVAITVTENHEPVARDDVIPIVNQSFISFNVVTNDSDADDVDGLTVTNYTQPSHGTVQCGPDGGCTYFPSGDIRDDTFTYTVSDGTASATARVSIVLITPTHVIEPVVTETGQLSLSVDALGTSDEAGGTIQVDKPSEGATVRAAYLAAASTGFSDRVLVDGDMSIEGVPVSWDITTRSAISYNSWADVTQAVKPIVDPAPAGEIDVHLDEVQTLGIDGGILAVVFDDPTADPTNTVVLLFGSQNVDGDLFAIRTSEPIDADDPHLVADLGLGISFGSQPQPNPQFSLIDVNGQRLSSAAGGQDDGAQSNGALITAGGVGDSNENPSDPNAGPTTDPRTDDELYDLRPFIADGDTSIDVFTINPSRDDNIFFASLLLSAPAIIGEGIVLAPGSSSGDVGTTHTVTATVQDSSGDPAEGTTVAFTVMSGPNAGETGTGSTDATGEASFTYTGTGGEGTDVLEASFTDSAGATQASNQVTRIWTQPAGNQPPIADDDVLVTNEDTAGTVDVLDGDTDPDGDSLTIDSFTQATNGTVTCDSAAGECTYTPNTGFTGTDGFTYTVADGNGGSDTGTVAVTVSPTNDPPVADDDTLVTDEDTAGTVDVLDGDSDPDGDALSIDSFTQGANGTVSCDSGTGECTYTPDPNFNGSDAFTYTVTDGSGQDTATVSVTVNPVNDPPVAVDDTLVTNEDVAGIRRGLRERLGSGRGHPDLRRVHPDAGERGRDVPPVGALHLYPEPELQRHGRVHLPGQRRERRSRGGDRPHHREPGRGSGDL